MQTPKVNYKITFICSDLNVRSFFVRGNCCSVLQHYNVKVTSKFRPWPQKGGVPYVVLEG